MVLRMVRVGGRGMCKLHNMHESLHEIYYCPNLILVVFVA